MKSWDGFKRLKAGYIEIKPEVPEGNSSYMLAIDIALAVMLVAAGIWFAVCATTPDERISVSVSADGRELSCFVFPDTSAAELIKETGIALRDGDEIAGAELCAGANVSISRAYPVAIRSAGQVSLLYMNGGTVGEALREAGVEHDVKDELTHRAFEDTAPGMKIIHTDVQTEYKTSYKTLEYKEEAVYDEKKYNDSDPELLQSGEDGTKQVTQRIIKMDGVEVSREVVDQIVITPAINEIKLYGSRIHYQTNYKGETRLYRKKPTAGKDGWIEMTMDYITAYSDQGRTATGTRTKFGTIAVNPKYVPYGTEIYVPGYGYGVARDTGAFRNYTKDDGTLVNQLDIWLESESDARRWGRKRNVTVLVKMG